MVEKQEEKSEKLRKTEKDNKVFKDKAKMPRYFDTLSLIVKLKIKLCNKSTCHAYLWTIDIIISRLLY